MSDARQYFHYSQPFDLKRGGQLPGFTLAWESWGKLAETRDNAILILTGLSPDAHAAANPDNPQPGWWEFMIGPGKPIDTDRWFVICANSLGSCKGSTGPASDNPETGRPWSLGFPELSLEDIATSSQLLVKSLGIDQLKVLVGPSMGGMTALAYQLQDKGAAENLISISSSAQSSPFTIAIRSLQREAIRADKRWNGGDYHAGEWPITGMRMARKLGVISYRSAEEWRGRFGRLRIPPERAMSEPFAPEFEIESYLEAHADRFVGAFDPNCYLYLSRAMDWFSASDYGSSIRDALAECGFKRALVAGVNTDILFPLHEQQAICDGLAAGGTDVDFQALPSIQGHDAFLVDTNRFSMIVGDFLESL
jgi:homoserine O-acetyltransferase